MTDYERIEKVIRHIDARFREQPSLEELACVAGLSEFHFQRLFTRWAGVSPKRLLGFVTSAHAKSLLREGQDLLSVSLDSGLSGPSRLHDLFVLTEAVTPGEFKRAGLGLSIRYGVHETRFGRCLIACTPRGICHLTFVDESSEDSLLELRTRWPGAELLHDPSFTLSSAEALFQTRAGGDRVALHLRGTPFQLKVWEALLRIPQGQVSTYSRVARSIELPGASRAVGTAVGRNPIACLIPCHRVLRETGHFGGYRWGGTRKRALLAWESAQPVASAGKLHS